jgi:signal transduction histidine kinase/DNA-binding response OmpR family regulator
VLPAIGSLGREARSVRDGDEALRMLAQERAAVLVVDARDDLEFAADVCRTVRPARAAGTCFVVAVTNLARRADIPALIEAGVDDCVRGDNPVYLDLRLRLAERLLMHERQNRQRETALSESERCMGALVGSLPGGVLVEDRARRVLFANDAFCALFDIRAPAESLRGSSCVEAAHHAKDLFAEPAKFIARTEEILRAGALVVGEELALRDGRIFERDFVPVPGGVGRVWHYRDVTEARRAYARAALAERMASLGTLAASMAHEINNPLACVIGNLDFVADEQGQNDGGSSTAIGPEQAQALEEAREGAHRIRDVVRDLRLFSSHDDDERRTAIDVRKALDTAARVAGNEVRHRATLAREYADVPPVSANERRLVQLFLHLLTNAAKALGEGGAAENKITLRTKCDDTGRAVIEIVDTGTGFSPESAARLLVPFLTTHRQGEGTELGLAICHGVVTGLGGEISAHSPATGGAVFRIVLPAAASPAPIGKHIVAPAVPPRARPRILVVDDEPMVGTVVRRILGDENDVVAVTSGGDALAALDAGHFDLVLCDLMMPRVSGMDLHEVLSQKWPDHARRMIFATGGAFTPRAREFVDRVPNPFLDKPFTANDLRIAVSRAMG